jgi:hypothetical protein
VITPRPGWQKQLLPAVPFLMQGGACKLRRVMPENFLSCRTFIPNVPGKALDFAGLRKIFAGNIF